MSPEPRPPDKLDRDRAILVLVDLQERLQVEVVRPQAVLSNALKLARSARILGVPVLVTEQNPKAFGPTLGPLREALGGGAAVSKLTFSAFGTPAFRDQVQALGRPQLVVAGYETHVCVSQTVLDSLRLGYRAHVVRDACASRTEENHALGLAKMEAAGALPASAESVIFEWLGEAGTDLFRKVLPILKGA
jgi:nicotinamidase-related amidase